jgi:hypothetical protein
MARRGRPSAERTGRGLHGRRRAPPAAAAVTGNTIDTESPGGAGLQIDLHESTVSGNSFEGNGTTGCLQLFGSQYGLVPSSEVSVTEHSFESCNGDAIQLSPEVEAIEIGQKYS